MVARTCGEQSQPVEAQFGFRRVDRDLVEEASSGARSRPDRASRPRNPRPRAARDRGCGIDASAASERLLLRQRRAVAATGVRRRARPSLRLLDAQDVGGAAVGGEQIRAVLGAEQGGSASTRASRRTRSSSSPSGEHRIEHIVAHALARAAGLSSRSAKKRTCRRGSACFADAEALAAASISGQQAQPQPVLADDADHAERGAAQRIGIARAGRLLADREEAGELVELVGQRHGDRDRRGRARSSGPARRVVVARWRRPRAGPRRRAARSSGP